nr:hypothetical protein Iba_chr12bCG0600 [Ipomoea batatas]
MESRLESSLEELGAIPADQLYKSTRYRSPKEGLPWLECPPGRQVVEPFEMRNNPLSKSSKQTCKLGCQKRFTPSSLAKTINTKNLYINSLAQYEVQPWDKAVTVRSSFFCSSKWERGIGASPSPRTYKGFLLRNMQLQNQRTWGPSRLEFACPMALFPSIISISSQSRQEERPGYRSSCDSSVWPQREKYALRRIAVRSCYLVFPAHGPESGNHTDFEVPLVYLSPAKHCTALSKHSFLPQSQTKRIHRKDECKRAE